MASTVPFQCHPNQLLGYCKGKKQQRVVKSHLMNTHSDMTLRPVIMLVDDQEPYTDVMCKVLDEYGFDVKVANSAHEAFELLESVIPDLMLLDIMMPQVDGITFLKLVRKDARLCVVPVVVVTAYHDTVDDAMQAGANNHLLKPFSAQELREAISEFVLLKPRH